MNEVLTAGLAVGQRLAAGARRMTRERMRWYCDALETAAEADGEFRIAEPTIHTDDEYARAQGLPGIIADGMLTTNWISSLLYSVFGLNYLQTGELQTKYIRPVYEDEIVRTFAEVTSRSDAEGLTEFELDVWCEVDGAGKCTVGTARVRVPSEKSSTLSREEN